MSDDKVTVGFAYSEKFTVSFPPPDRLRMCDETGQAWEITVRPDGQLQTQRLPDGEPLTAQDYANRVIKDALKIVFSDAGNERSID